MGIKYLKGIYSDTKPKTTRPPGLEFPIGLNVIGGGLTANGANTTTTETFDILLVAGGGGGGGRRSNPSLASCGGGGGGSGGLRVFSGNSFTEITEYTNAFFTTGVTNFIPVIVGGSGGDSCFGQNFVNCRGGGGGAGAYTQPAYGANSTGVGGGAGGSGGGGGQGGVAQGAGGTGIFGQGCNGGPGGPGGSALANASTTGGLTSSITGTNIRYADGGTVSSGATPGTANRGNGGNGISGGPGPTGGGGGAGGSGIVAIRYRNPAAPEIPLATGGDCVCCTGGCIIHIFNSSGFLNVTSDFSIN